MLRISLKFEAESAPWTWKFCFQKPCCFRGRRRLRLSLPLQSAGNSFLDPEDRDLRMVSARLLSYGYSISCERLIVFSKAETEMHLRDRIIVTVWLHGLNFSAGFNL